MDSKKKTFSNPWYHKPYHISPPKKNLPGPGQNYENIEKALDTQILRSSQSFVIPKAKKIYFTQTMIKNKEGVPGVSLYVGASEHNTISKNAEKNTFTKEMQELIRKNNKIIRFSEVEGKAKAWVPGPGAYDVLPKPRVFNK